MCAGKQIADALNDTVAQQRLVRQQELLRSFAASVSPASRPSGGSQSGETQALELDECEAVTLSAARTELLDADEREHAMQRLRLWCSVEESMSRAGDSESGAHVSQRPSDA